MTKKTENAKNTNKNIDRLGAVVAEWITASSISKTTDFHTGGPRFESQARSSALGQGTSSSLPSPSERTFLVAR